MNDELKKKTHDSRLYRCWSHMKSRCENPKTPDWPRYGGRGIKICKSWHSFDSFAKDMLPTYKPDLTLDRINNHGNYSKQNCRWATPKEQASNTRNMDRARKYTFNGLTLTVGGWSERLGIKKTTIAMRLQFYKFPLEKALQSKLYYDRS